MLDSIIIVGVTKGRTVDDILGLYNRGIRIFGENKVQETIKKMDVILREPQYDILKKAEFHMIGHLQTNKVKEAVKIFDMIQSVDSLRLLAKIKREAEKAGKIMHVLIQVNVSHDPKKFGILPENILEFFRQTNPLLCSKWIKIEGLMAIVEHTQDVEARRVFFRKMKEIFDDLKTLLRQGHVENVEMKYLSMGMSEDFKSAIEEGANMVRIGRALFELQISKSK